jgi:hypothetical protein
VFAPLNVVVPDPVLFNPTVPASTALTPALKNHGVTVVDTSTPLDGTGKPLFDTNGVWDYLCFQ